MNLAFVDAWRQQIDWCAGGGSPVTARVLEAALSDWLGGGTLRELIPDWNGDPLPDAVSLRVAGALHSLVLDGSDPELAAHYPPLATGFDPVAAPAAVRRALSVHRERIAEYLQHPPQTNEVGRSAALLGGFSAIAAQTGLPLALREVGASAGLNLLWHRYRYELGEAITWGDPSSPVLIRSEWQGYRPPLLPDIAVASWQGCDAAPIDLGAAHAATRLASYVWPDQHERLARLQAAIALAKSLHVRVERADAVFYLQRELSARRNGETTVVYHSIVWQYLDAGTQAAIRSLLDAAGERATPAAPLAWLALEPPHPKARPQRVLTTWPGGQRVILATAQPHGRFVRWGAAETVLTAS